MEDVSPKPQKRPEKNKHKEVKLPGAKHNLYVLFPGHYTQPLGNLCGRIGKKGEWDFEFTRILYSILNRDQVSEKNIYL